MTWRRYMFRHYLTHVVPADLSELLLADLAARGSAELAPIPPGVMNNPATISEWWLDMGGSKYQDRPVETFAWAGLVMGVPSEHVGAIADQVRALRVRHFADGTPYLKLKLWFHATVMTPAQCLTLLDAVEGLTASAAERARLFQAAVRRGIAQGVS